MIEKEFVKYEEALALKELGFDEPCLKYWNGIGKYFDQKDWFNWNQSEKFVSIPLYQQAFRWFREKYGLRNSITDFIDDETGIEWDYEIAIIGTDVDEKVNYNPIVDYSTDDETRKFKTYEEAELACLKQLIQIAKIGAKWQQERMYSEEEVLKFLNKREEYMNSEDDILEYKSIDQWFEQFKKK